MPNRSPTTRGDGLETARRAAVRLARKAQADGRAPSDLALRLARRPKPEERRIACELAVIASDDDARDAMALLGVLVEDADRAVRTAAVAAAARIARAHFERVLDLLAEWRGAASPLTRRAAAAVAARSAEPRRLERAPHLARFVKPLLGDPDPTVRRALTSSTLPAFLRAFPEAAFEALVESSTSSDPRVLRDVAAAFAAPAAAPLAKRALIILRKLALDERRVVWRAAAAAMWRLGRRRPDVVRPELDRWLEDDARQTAAREALKYL
jgi:hypothetical protein